MLQTIISVLLIVMGIFLVISVLMQSSKDHRLSGSIAGGAETFFGKTKGRTLDAMFNKLTTVVTIVFVILVLVLYFMQAKKIAETPVETAPVEEASGEVVDETAETIDETAETVEETIDETAETVDETAETVEETVDEAAETVEETVEEATEPTTEEQGE